MLKIDDFVIAPKGCATYLTPGKKYFVIDVNDDTFSIIDDLGFILWCQMQNSLHLNGQDWKVFRDDMDFIKTADLKLLLKKVTKGELSFQKMTETINQMAIEFYKHSTNKE